MRICANKCRSIQDKYDNSHLLKFKAIIIVGYVYVKSTVQKQ